MKLLRLHTAIESDEDAKQFDVQVEEGYRVLPPQTNPSDKRQRVDVLEFGCYAYKGFFLIRLHYLRTPHACLLGAQEIRTLGSW